MLRPLSPKVLTQSRMELMPDISLPIDIRFVTLPSFPVSILKQCILFVNG